VSINSEEVQSDAADKDHEISRLRKLQQRLVDETVEVYGYRYQKRTDGKGPAAGNPMCDVCFQKNGSSKLSMFTGPAFRIFGVPIVRRSTQGFTPTPIEQQK
jgi:hypothetical protein